MAATVMRLLRRRKIGRQPGSFWQECHGCCYSTVDLLSFYQQRQQQPASNKSSLARCYYFGIFQPAITKPSANSVRPITHHHQQQYRSFSLEAGERIRMVEKELEKEGDHHDDNDVLDMNQNVQKLSSSSSSFYYSNSSLRKQRQQQQQLPPTPDVIVKSKPNGKVIIVHEKPWQANHLQHYFNGHSHRHAAAAAAAPIEQNEQPIAESLVRNVMTAPTTVLKESDLNPHHHHLHHHHHHHHHHPPTKVSIPVSEIQELIQMQHDTALLKDNVTEATALCAQELWETILKSYPELDTAPPAAAAVEAIVNIWTKTHQANWILQAQDVVKNAQGRRQSHCHWYDATTLPPNQHFELLHLFILQAWARRGDGSRAQSWLNHMMRQSNNRQQHNLNMNVEHGDDNENDDMSSTSITAFNLVLEAWTKHAHRHPKRLERAFGLFQHMQKQGQATGLSYFMLLNALSKLEGKKKKQDALPRARELFDEYCQTSSSSSSSHDGQVYKAMMELEAHVGNGPRTEELLRQLQQKQPQQQHLGNEQVQRPTRIHYHLAMQAWTRSSIVPADDRGNVDEHNKDHTNSYAVERLLAFLEEMKSTNVTEHDDDKHNGLQPCRQTYAYLIEAFCRHCPTNQNKSGGWAQQAHRLWEEMLARYHEEGDSDCMPTPETSFPLVWGWADLARGDMVESIIQQLWEAQVTPRLHEYRAALEAWSRSKDPEAPERIEELLNEMWRRSYEEGHDHLKPNRSIHSSAIETLVARDNRHAVLKAQSILQAMWFRSVLSGDKVLQPSLNEYQLVSNAWARLGDTRAVEDLASQVKQWNLWPINQPSLRTTKDFSREPKSRSDIQKSNNEIDVTKQKQPSVVKLSTTTPMQPAPAAVPSETSDTSLQIMSKQPGFVNPLPDHMVRLHQDVESYNNAIQELGQSRDGRQMAVALFEEMLQRAQEGEAHLHPNLTSYQAVISALVRIRKNDTRDRAFEIFQIMVDKARLGEGQFQPNLEIYSSLIQAFSLSGEADRCQMLLEQMVVDSCWDSDCPVPELRLFNMAIAAWSRSDKSDAGERGETLLRWMQTLGTQYRHLDVCPDKVSYSNAMKAWVACSENNPEQALERLEGLLQELLDLWKRKGGEEFQPDIVTYLTAATGIAKSSHLSDQEKSRRFQVLFRTMKDQKLKLDARAQAALKRFSQGSPHSLG